MIFLFGSIVLFFVTLYSVLINYKNMQKLIKDFLIERTGYLKKSPYKIAERLNIEVNDENIKLIKDSVRQIKGKLKVENERLNNIKANGNNKFKFVQLEELKKIEEENKQFMFSSKEFIPNKTDLISMAVENFMATGDYDKAIDFINKIRQDEITPKYNKSSFESGNYIVLGCLHFPFVNKDFFNSVLNLIKDCPDLKGIVLAGDILDMSSISRHNKGLMPVLGYTLEREYRETNEFLDELDKAIGDREIRKEYFSGNHEDWYYQWKKDVDNAKLGSASTLSPYDACFKSRGYNFQKDWKNARINIGDLEIIHGIFTTVTSAQKHLNALKRNVLFFHTHRFNTHIEGKLEAFNCGWGGDKNAPVFNYMSDFQKETWRNGMAVVNLTEEGLTNVTAIPYKNGLFFNNKLY